jgi:hypothetical protein
MELRYFYYLSKLHVPSWYLFYGLLNKNKVHTYTYCVYRRQEKFIITNYNGIKLHDAGYFRFRAYTIQIAKSTEIYLSCRIDLRSGYVSLFSIDYVLLFKDKLKFLP